MNGDTRWDRDARAAMVALIARLPPGVAHDLAQGVARAAAELADNLDTQRGIRGKIT